MMQSKAILSTVFCRYAAMENYNWIMNGAFGGRKSSVCIDGFEIMQSSLHSGRSRTSI